MQLNYLNLSSNNFSQKIPEQLSKLPQLSTLDLSQNSLSGEILSQITSFQSLDWLSLSHNNLSGSIPKEFEDMHWLQHIDISYNELEGPIPNGKAFMNASIEQLQGNKALCGNVTGLQPCKNHFPVNKKTSQNNRTLILIIVLPLGGAVLLLGAFIGLLIMFDRRKRKAETDNTEDANLYSISVFDGRGMYDAILKATKNFDATYCIGKGGYGTVYKAELPSANIVAMKKLHPLFKRDDRQGSLIEVRALT